MCPIYIFGSSGFVKEVFFLISEINKFNFIYDFKGFIDIESNQIKISNKTFNVFEESIFFEKKKTDGLCFALGTGSPQINEKIIKTLHRKLDLKNQFPNLIHPNFIGLKDDIHMGFGNIVTANNIFTVSISIGNFNIFNLNCTVGHDSNILDYNVINPGANISGGVQIGNSNLIGTNATILQNIQIGNNNVIGAGTLVRQHIKDNHVVVGVPGREIK